MVFTGSSAPAGATEILMAGTVIIMFSYSEGLSTHVTVIVTLKSLAGGAAGAMYVVAAPLAVAPGKIVPHGDAEHDTAQVTPLFGGSLVTVAVNCAVLPANTVVGPGVTLTMISGTLTVAEANTDGLDTEVAVIVALKTNAGGVPGAV